ncbi:GGDEF-domain containing protein, partial [Pseudomonas sp. CCI1.2]|nr:GGDEF-domain containing protein [Pseudomonas sp. CCI1.2]
VGHGPYILYYGDLRITLDSATYGESFIVISVIIFFSGVLRALSLVLVVFLFYEWLVTKPLSKFIENLSYFNPDRPS